MAGPSKQTQVTYILRVGHDVVGSLTVIKTFVHPLSYCVAVWEEGREETWEPGSSEHELRVEGGRLPVGQ